MAKPRMKKKIEDATIITDEQPIVDAEKTEVKEKPKAKAKAKTKIAEPKEESATDIIEGADLNKIPEHDFNPMMSDAVDEKGYGNVTAEITGKMPNKIPEQQIEAPKIDLNEFNAPIEDDTNDSKEPSSPKFSNPEPADLPFNSAETDPVNPYTTQMQPKDKKAGAEKLADMILFGYKWLWEQGYTFFSLEEDRVQKKAIKGRMDIDVLSVKLPMSDTESMRIGDFLDDYNEKLKDLTTVGDEFIEEVKPVLTRIFEKRGIGMTDEQFLIYTIGKDAVPRISGIIGIKIAVNQVLAMGNEMLKELRISNSRQYAAPQPPQQEEQYNPPPQVKSRPKKEPEPKIHTVENSVENGHEDIIEDNSVIEQSQGVEPPSQEQVEAIEKADEIINESLEEEFLEPEEIQLPIIEEKNE